MRTFKEKHPYLFWQLLGLVLLLIALSNDFVVIRIVLGIFAGLIMVISPVIIYIKKSDESLEDILNGEEDDDSSIEVEPIIDNEKVIEDTKKVKKYNYRLPSIGTIQDNEEYVSYLSSLSKDKLEVPIGNYNDRKIIADFYEQPNLLISGTSLDDKTSFINSLVTSLLFFQNPYDLDLVFIKNNNVNYIDYSNIPHVKSNIINNMVESPLELSSITRTIEERYDMLLQSNCKNIYEYNEKNQNKLTKKIIVIDELNSNFELLGYIDFISSKGPTVGIYTILSVGKEIYKDMEMILYNFSNRICFRVDDKQDSLYCIQESGAESLKNGYGLLQNSSNEPASLVKVISLSLDDSEKIVKIWEEKYKKAKNKRS